MYMYVDQLVDRQHDTLSVFFDHRRRTRRMAQVDVQNQRQPGDGTAAASAVSRRRGCEVQQKLLDLPDGAGVLLAGRALRRGLTSGNYAYVYDARDALQRHSTAPTRRRIFGVPEYAMRDLAEAGPDERSSGSATER
jgi:hypothetical protein